jgi:hypothetical protein
MLRPLTTISRTILETLLAAALLVGTASAQLPDSSFTFRTDAQLNMSSLPPYEGSHDAIYAYIDEHFDAHLENIQRWLRQPSGRECAILSVHGAPRTSPCIRWFRTRLLSSRPQRVHGRHTRGRVTDRRSTRDRTGVCGSTVCPREPAPDHVGHWVTSGGGYSGEEGSSDAGGLLSDKGASSDIWISVRFPPAIWATSSARRTSFMRTSPVSIHSA